MVAGRRLPAAGAPRLAFPQKQMSASKTITIPAAVNGVAGVAEYNGRGKVFACLTTTADFQIQIGDDDLEDVSNGTVLGDPTRKPFGRIIFYNATANDIVATISVSNNTINPAVLNSVGNISVAAVKDAPTYVVCSSNALVANNSVTFNGLNNGRQRRQIVLQNKDNSTAIAVRDNSNNEGFALQPGAAVTLMTNGIVKLYNPGPGAVTYDVLETFYS